MFENIERFAELYECLGVKLEILKTAIWVEYNRMIVPVGPAKLEYSISENEARFLLSKFPHTFLVRYTDGFAKRAHCCEEWYAVICDSFTEMDDLPSKNRCEISRGLKNCSVKMVEANFIAEHDYNVFISAL